jgi:methylenetetrahydrofolate dehydrogenase (NADP+) / methenyltetrahydrofolate cyclohydrolase
MAAGFVAKDQDRNPSKSCYIEYKKEASVPAEILDGRALAQQFRMQTALEVAELASRTRMIPGLTVILVGSDPASQVYVRNKETACKAAGMNGTVLRLPTATTQAELLATIDHLNDDPTVHGILVQLPLPSGIDQRAVVQRLLPSKDVDGLHPLNLGLLAEGCPRFVPCTPLGVRELLIHAQVETRGANAVVLGRSQLVGKPMALLLLQKGVGGDATVTVCHTATRDASSIARQADILVVAVGRPEQVTADWVKPGAVVIDVGIHKRADGKLCGDVHFESVADVASRITPVPGGVGPLTIAMLLRNTLHAARLALAATQTAVGSASEGLTP